MSLEDSDNMCKPQDSQTSDSTPEAPSTNNKPKAGEKDEHGYVTNQTSAEDLATTWCCGLLHMAPPKSGTELGVWEKSLEDQSNWFTWITLSYLNPMLKLGSNKVLDVDDIGVVSEQDKARAAYEQVKACWEAQIRKTEAANAYMQAAFERKLSKCNSEEAREALRAKQPPPDEPSLEIALFQGYGWWKLVGAMLIYLISALFAFVPVIILEDIVRFFQSDGAHETYTHPWVEVFGLALVPFVVSILQTRYQCTVAHAGVFVRAAVSLMLYHKSLKVSAAGRAKTSTGQVVNIMSNDSQQLQRLLLFAGMGVVAPVQIILALTLIYRQVGNAMWAGVAFMLALAPLNGMVFGVIGKLRRKVLKYSDSRVKMMNEILMGIRIIKFYAWEKPFGKEVDRLRGKELDALTKYAYFIACIFSLILSSVPFIQPILVFSVYTAVQDEPLDAGTAFSTIALFNLMRIPFAFLPMVFLQWIQGKIAIKRVGRYLELPELNTYVENNPPPNANTLQTQIASVTIRDGTFAWVDPSGKQAKGIEDDKKPKPERRASGRSSRRSSKASATENEQEDGSKRMNFANKELQASIHSLQTTNSEEGSTAAPVMALTDINTTIQAGSLVAVVGPVGSGKSSLLSAILGEMEPADGSKVYIPRDTDKPEGFVSYTTQTPWVVNDTLKGNILFGRPFDEARYEMVIEAAALIDDLAVLPAGDATEIGEHGINLSGGQKARVSLARALYGAYTKLMLLDDPLSAVDSHVGEHLFTKAICGEVSKGATRILVTHASHVLSRCDYVIVMEKGTIKHQGKYADLIASGVDFAGAVDVSKHEKTDKEGEAEEKEDQEKEDGGGKGQKEEEVSDEKKAAMRKSGKKLTSDEEKEEGSVSGSAYVKYAKAGGFLAAFSVLACAIFGRGSDVAGAFWLSKWAEEGFEATANGMVMSDADTRFYLGIYSTFALCGLLGITLQGICFANLRLRASRKLHKDLTDSILCAPIAFFDVTPIGRVLNRFAADMDKVDLELVQSLQQGLSMLFSILGAVGAIIAATKGTFLIPMIPLGYVYYLIQGWFRKTSTELQRITSINNSPIFADFSQTLSGTSSIRAYGASSRFASQCEASFDKMDASYILVQVVNQWLALRLDVLGGLVGFFIGAFAMATRNSSFAIPAGWVGLALNYSIELTGYLKFGVRMIAQTEADMSSVERILYYSNNIEAEAPDEIPEKDPPADSWPSKGAIQFQNAAMRYRDGPLVLKGVSLDIQPGEKIGVCGRTGSGKSSLMISLFRISEIEMDGKILIDGVNTAEIGTSALRMGLSIIPQDPVMFSNTIRYNLDPFATASEEELWTVLQKVRMVEAIASLPNGLDHEVAEGGENFSLGQRQLICIARSLLRKPKILVMDEATASIDNETDAQIQQMIRENFGQATVLTIAHRLNTIMDSDRILVLDDGHIAEFDTPAALLHKETGHFRSMVEKSKKAHGEG